MAVDAMVWTEAVRSVRFAEEEERVPESVPAVEPAVDCASACEESCTLSELLEEVAEAGLAAPALRRAISCFQKPFVLSTRMAGCPIRMQSACQSAAARLP